jgi:hypothetical protein
MMMFEDLMAWVVPDRERCQGAADDLRAEHPGATPEQLARRAIAEARNWGIAAGGTTGAAANPLIMFPAAMADIAAMLRIEGQMAGTIAALMDPSSLLDENTLRADVLAIVFPGAVSQALRQIGLRAGQRVTRSLIQKYVTESFIKDVTRFATKFLFIRVTRKAVVSKTVPLVGAGIGAAWNWLEVEAVGKRAIRYYQRRAIGPTVPVKADATTKVSIRQIVRTLPWRRSEPAQLPPPPPPPASTDE